MFSRPTVHDFFACLGCKIGQSYARGTWVRSITKKFYGPLAHPVEHCPFKAGVPRSSRGWPTILRADGEIGRRASLRN